MITKNDVSSDSLMQLQQILNEMNNSAEIKDEFKKIQSIEDNELKMKMLENMPELKEKLDKLAEIIGKENVYR